MLTVGIVTASVVAVMVLNGYELVITESVTMIMITGLAVDYVIHLAQSYVFSPHNHRSRRMKQAYQEMGVSIFSGMTTTIGASAFLLLGQIIQFEKFAVIIISTAVFSFLTSMLFFGALMHIFGPQNRWGNLLVCDCCVGMDPTTDERTREMETKFLMEER